MADVEVQLQISERKVRKTKKSTTTSKRRESSDQGSSEVTITEIDKENQQAITNSDQGWVRLLSLT